MKVLLTKKPHNISATLQQNSRTDFCIGQDTSLLNFLLQRDINFKVQVRCQKQTKKQTKAVREGVLLRAQEVKDMMC